MRPAAPNPNTPNLNAMSETRHAAGEEIPDAQNADPIGWLTSKTLEMIDEAQRATERLAGERARNKLSSNRESAVARELGQLRIVLAGYKYKNSIDRP